MSRFTRTFAEDSKIIDEIVKQNVVGDERENPIPKNELTSNTAAGTNGDALPKAVSFFSSQSDLRVKVPSIKWNQGWLQTAGWLRFNNNTLHVKSKYYVNVLRKTPGVVEIFDHVEYVPPPTTQYPINKYKKV